MNPYNIDWEEVEKKIASFGVDIYPLEECSFGELIGLGSAMEVFEGKCNINMISKRVAFKHHQRFKIPRLRQHDVNTILGDFQHEIILMKRLKFHTNVVQILGVTFSEGKPILIVELGDETLDRYLRDKAESGTPANWVEKVKLGLDVLRGIHGLHDAGIIHGDIKGENILVFINASGTATAKISDFGYSSTLTSSKGNVGGTPCYMAPEAMGRYPELIYWQKKPTQDIFSFGLVAYQIATNGQIPYDDADDIFDAKDADREMKSLLANLPHDTPEQFRTIIISTTKFMPTDRASIESVEQMFWNFLNGPSSKQSNINSETIETIIIPDNVAPLMVDKTVFVPIDRSSLESEKWRTLPLQHSISNRAEAQKRLEGYAKKIGFNLDKDDINIIDMDDTMTPLFWSASEGNVEVIRILVDEYRANMRTKTKKGLTPLHYAAENGHIEAVRLLVNECGVDANAKNNYGDTPLHLAAEKGHVEVVKLLTTEYGANGNLKNKNGFTPLRLAGIRGYAEIVRLLETDASSRIKF